MRCFQISTKHIYTYTSIFSLSHSLAHFLFLLCSYSFHAQHTTNKRRDDSLSSVNTFNTIYML